MTGLFVCTSTRVKSGARKPRAGASWILAAGLVRAAVGDEGLDVSVLVAEVGDDLAVVAGDDGFISGCEQPAKRSSNRIVIAGRIKSLLVFMTSRRGNVIAGGKSKSLLNKAHNSTLSFRAQRGIYTA